MLTVYSPKHRLHDPPSDFFEGRLEPYPEMPRRVEIIRGAVEEADLGDTIAPRDFGLEPILAVHTASYLDHLRTIYDDWIGAGFPPVPVLPAVFPRPGQDRHSSSPQARAGRYSFDMSAPITATSYEAILSSAQCALSGAALLLEGENSAYALCRPPGHHVSAALMGGFCYLNNVAIAAHFLVQRGARVAILDIDVHHGNGTQAIFYDRSDVLFISIHGSPEWEYPYFAGYADERGLGRGEGYNLNYPMPKGVGDADYLTVCGGALRHIRDYAPDYLLISAGFDAYEHDPLGKLRLTTPGFEQIGRAIAALKLPVLVVQEGGYAVEQLGLNVVSFLRGLIGG